MGSYLNPGSGLFEMALRSQIFVDKSGLIEKTNHCVRTLQRYMCVSRPRRFGKSFAAKMLAAYYSRGADSKDIFQNLKIGKETKCENQNQYERVKISDIEEISLLYSTAHRRYESEQALEQRRLSYAV